MLNQRAFQQVFFLCTLFCLSLAVFTSKAQALSLDQVRFGAHPGKTRLVFDLSRESKFRVFSLAEPYRLVIDLPSFEWQAGDIEHPQGSSVLAVRHGTLEPGVSRIVFDMDKPVEVRTAFTLPEQPGKPHRLVIDYSTTTEQNLKDIQNKIFGADTLTELAKPQFQSYKTASLSTMAPPPTPEKKAVQPPVQKPLIVIDPGHGGIDPGATGSNKVYEKHVVLALSKDLKEQLEKSGKYRVLMTRDKDVFIKLRDRVAFARNNGADLFVSIHADSIEKSNVRGASFYTLSEKASDSQTAQLAARENKADLIAGVDLSHEDHDVANILVDLAVRDTSNQGKFFANKVVDSFKGHGLNVLPNPHRHAGFAVLKAPDIPSILVEAGFMSNSREARALNTSDYRQKIAKALKDGIDRYFEHVERNQR